MRIRLSVLAGSILFFLAACGGDKSEYIQPPSPFAGIWMGKSTAVEMRKTKALESNCNQMKTEGFISAMVIDKNGNLFDYEIGKDSKEILQQAGTVSRDGKAKVTRGTGLEAQASLQGDSLTFTVHGNLPFHVHYIKSTKEEVANFGALKTLCKLDQLTGNL